MWKAIWWALAGIPLGFVFGGVAGVVAATVITAVAGAVNWRWHMCDTRSGGGPVAVCGVVAGVAVVAVAAHAVLPFLLPAAAVLAVLAVATVPAMRWLARRLTVPKWSARYERQAHVIAARERAERRRAKVYWEGSVLPWRQEPLAIEAPRPRVPGVIIQGEVMERDVV